MCPAAILSSRDTEHDHPGYVLANTKTLEEVRTTTTNSIGDLIHDIALTNCKTAPNPFPDISFPRHSLLILILIQTQLKLRVIHWIKNVMTQEARHNFNCIMKFRENPEIPPLMVTVET